MSTKDATQLEIFDRKQSFEARSSPLPCYTAGVTDDDEWEDGEEWCETCNNMGVLDCHCGGDLCVCMRRGEYPCPDCW